MKSIIASIILLSTVIVGTGVGSVLLCKDLANIAKNAENIDTDSNDFTQIYEKAKELEAEYESSKLILSLFLDDNDEHAISDYIKDIKSAAEAKDTYGIQLAKNRLISETEKTRRLFTVNLDSIF